MTTDGSAGRAATDGLFSRVNPGRASEMIVDQIRLLIRDGSLKPGDRLPAEGQQKKGGKGNRQSVVPKQSHQKTRQGQPLDQWEWDWEWE